MWFFNASPNRATRRFDSRDIPVTKRTSISWQQGGWIQSLMAAAGLLFFAGQARSQEALRMSLAGDLAAETQRQAANTLGYYNLLLGADRLAVFLGVGIGIRRQHPPPIGEPAGGFHPSPGSEHPDALAGHAKEQSGCLGGRGLFRLRDPFRPEPVLHESRFRAFLQHLRRRLCDQSARLDFHHGILLSKSQHRATTAILRGWKTRPAPARYGT